MSLNPTKLAFHIHAKESERTRFLAILVNKSQKQGLDRSFIEIPPLSPPQWKQLASQPQEKQILEFLTEEELKFQRKHKNTIPLFNLFHIDPTRSIQALELFSLTSMLFFEKRALVIDLHTKNQFYYAVDTKNALSGRFKSIRTEFDLKELDFILQGSPCCFIKGIVLQMVDEETSWSEINAVLSGKIELKELQRFISKGDVDASKVLYAGKQETSSAYANGPFPLLILTDRTGAFANLWMDYGEGERVEFHDPRVNLKEAIRNKSVEAGWEKDLLETNFVRKTVGNSHYYCSMDKVAKSLSFLLEMGWKVLDFQDNTILHPSKTALEFTHERGHIQVRGKISYGNHQAEVQNVIGAFNRRDRFVQLSSGFVGLLPTERLGEGLAEIAEAGEIFGEGVRVSRYKIGEIEGAMSYEGSTIDEKLKDWKKQREHGQANTVPGECFQGSLREYQREGLTWLSMLYRMGFHGILADDMGLGKTVQVLALISTFAQEGPILLVLPTSLVFNWEKEIQRFLPSKNVYKHQGGQREKDPSTLMRKEIIITSYALMRIDVELFKQMQFSCVIVDEAQAIKNSSTQISKAICSLNSQFRLSITGTPIENQPMEIWSHFQFLMPGLLGSQEEFTAEIAASEADARYLRRIQKRIKPFILRRKKDQVAQDLPPLVEQAFWVEMQPEQQRLYDQLLSGFRAGLLKKVRLEGLKSHRMEIFEALLRLRQVCCHPLLVASQFENQETYQSAKLEALIQDIETAISEKAKILVYSQFTSMLQIIAKELRERNYRFVYLDGHTKDRQQVVEAFQNDLEIPLFLVSLKAGGTGLNLTAADYVFLYDPWWNEAVELQAIHRAHRIGSTHVVIAKRYLVVNTIEEKMMHLKSVKKKMIEGLLEDQFDGVTFSEEDVEFLFS